MIILFAITKETGAYGAEGMNPDSSWIGVEYKESPNEFLD
jgi:hypothetical protein